MRVSPLVVVTTSSAMASFVWVTIFFDRLTLTHAFISSASDYSECTLLTLKPLLRLLFYATIIYGEINFFLHALDGICLWVKALVEWTVISLHGCDEAPRSSFGASGNGGTNWTIGGTTIISLCFRFTWRLTLSERPSYSQRSAGHLTIACLPWLLNASNVGYVMGCWFMAGAYDDGVSSWGSCLMAQPEGPERHGLTMYLNIQMKGSLTNY